MTKEDFIGTWKLVSYTIHRSSGEVTHPWGQAITGRIIYDALGNMAVQFMRTDRPQFESDLTFGGTPAEKQAAYEGLFAYFGTYEIDSTAGTVAHHIESSSFPNWAGTSQVRFFEISPDHLTLTVPPVQSRDGTRKAILVWERIA